MKWITIGCIIFLCLHNSRAQTPGERAALASVFAPPQPPAYAYARQDIGDEYAWTLSRLFLFYKKYISSQDGGSCSFTPSCSEYAILSFKQFGPAGGALRTFDRLSRCHPGAAGYYPIHPELRMLVDPVE